VPVPGSEEEFKKVIFEAGRGRPKCQDDNVLAEASVLNGVTTIRVLADAPALRNTLSSKLSLAPGAMLGNPMRQDQEAIATDWYRVYLQIQ